MLKNKKVNITQEIISGLIMFLAIIYILPVNATILSSSGANYQSVFIATAICSGICCIIMGLFANYPVILSAGMGMNAFLAYTVCLSLGYSFNQALLMVFIAGIILLVLTLTSIREKIVSSIPKSLKYSLSAGLGGFICFVGLKNGGVIQSSSSTLVSLGDLSNPTVLLTIFGLFIVFILMQFKGKIGKMAIVIAMIITAILGIILNAFNIDNMPHFTMSNPLENFLPFKNNFGNCFSKDSFDIFKKPETYAIIFSILFVQLFDSTATLIAVGKDVGMLDENGKLVNGKKAMLADSIGAIICAPLGTSSVTCYAESAIGVECGSKSGLSAITTGILFLLSIFLYPLFSVFSSVSNGLTPITSLALISVGSMMFKNLKYIDWEDKIIVITSFIMIIMMILCYSISDGLGIALIFYCVMMLFNKKAKQVPWMIYGIAVLFLFSYILKFAL